MLVRGLAYLVTESQTIYIGPSIQALSLPLLGIGMSPAFLIALGLVVVSQLVLTRTVFGRYGAIGTNELAAKISGIHAELYLNTV